MSQSSYKILLIEINELDSELTKREIKKLCPGAEFLVIKTKAELLRALSIFKPAVIVLDPGINDIYELISDVAYFKDAGISIVVHTSVKNESAAFEFLNSGAWDYIPKEDNRRLGYSVKNAAEHFTARKEMFYARRDIEEFEAYVKKYRDWETHIPAIVFSFILKSDGSKHFTYLSSASKRYLGHSPEEIVKNTSVINKLIHPDDLSTVMQGIYDSAQNLTPFDQEIRLLLNGEVRWFHFFSNPERNSNNETIWSGIMVDVTDRKKIEEALTAEHYLMHVLMDNSPDVIYFKDLESRFLTVNKSYLKKMGMQSEKEVAGKTDFDFFGRELSENSRRDEIEIINTGKPVIDKIEKVNFAEGIKWMSTTKLPLRDKNGIITGTFGISRDITERKTAEEAFNSERNLLRILIDALPDYIYVKDKEERFIINNKAHLDFINRKNQEIYRRESIESIYGKSNFDIIDEGLARMFHEEDMLVLGGTPVYNHEVRIGTSNENYRYLLSTKLPLRNAEGEIIGLVGITHDATESILMHEQLRISEERMRYIINSTSSVLFNIKPTDSGISFIWVGDNVKYLLGYSPEEVMHPGWWEECIHPDDLDFIEKSLPALYKSKRLNLEFRIKHAEKHYVWVNTELNISAGVEGVQHGIFGSWVDITERMMAQEALLKSEEQLAYALKVARLAYWEYDVQEDLFIFNEQVYDVLGTTVEQQNSYTLNSGDFINKFIHPGDANEITEALNKASLNELNYGSRQIEFRNISNNGVVRYFLFIIYTSSGSNGKIYGILQDITESKIHITALKESEKKLSNALKIAHLAYWEYDVVNDLFTFNDQFYSLFRTNAAAQGGYVMSSAEYANRFVHPDDMPLVGQEVEKAITTTDPGFNSYLEHRINYADGETGYVGVRFFIVKDSSGKTIKSFGANQEITDRVKREMEKRELEKELLLRNKELEKMLDDMTRMQKTLVQSEKMASLGELSAGIAHEINNPLSYVCSNVNRLKEYFDDTVSLLQKWNGIKPQLCSSDLFNSLIKDIDAYSSHVDMEFILQDFDRMMHSIQDGTQRIKKIVEGMRGFSHISENSMVKADINKAIDDTITIVWNELKYKAVIEKEYSTLPGVKCNIGEIKQVLVNLLVNAAHAIEEKGVIKVCTLQEDGYVFIKVSDNGCGIPEDKIKRIFDPFFTTKPVGKGTGLGLWISSTIIAKHNGSLTVDSQPGTGSTFTVKIPLDLTI